MRRKIAANPNTEPLILGILADDKDEVRSVRLAVAQNPNTPLSVMERFSMSPDESFRLAIAENPGLSPAGR